MLKAQDAGRSMVLCYMTILMGVFGSCGQGLACTEYPGWVKHSGDLCVYIAFL